MSNPKDAPPQEPIKGAQERSHHRMTGEELRSSLSLAAIFAMRMLGLFLIMPVFTLDVSHMAGGQDKLLVGWAMGIYGLTQAILQVPLGLASDHYGRKRVIVMGLLVFAIGSVLAACSTTVYGLVLGRAVQGAGAISAAVTALLADLTRDEVRSKGMAMVGSSIGLMFALSMMMAPTLDSWFGLEGIFMLTGVLALIGIALVVWVTPKEPERHNDQPQWRASDLKALSKLWRLDFGVFVLHAIQMSMWVVVPGLLLQAGLAKQLQWHVYVPAVLLSIVALVVIFGLERGRYLRQILRAGIALLVLVQLALLRLAPSEPSVFTIGVVLFFFFVAFMMLEATQPSLISRLAPSQSRGAALGVYNTLQSLGLFAGGVIGGLLFKHLGPSAVFYVTSSLAVLWLALGWVQSLA